MKRLVVLSAVLLLIASGTARADGIDVAWYLSRVPGWHRSPLWASFLLVGLMLLNYALNYIVLGLPAVKWGASERAVLMDLVGLTLVGQLIDRIGAVIGPGFLGPLAAKVFELKGSGLGPGLGIGLYLNFALSGVAIAALANFYLKRRWLLAGRRVTVLSFAAGLATNPIWAILAVNLLGMD